MQQRIAHIALVVKDYDEAIEFYTKKLDFNLLEDTRIDADKRWVVVAPPGAKECALLLAKAVNEEQAKSIGNQTGGRVFLFLFRMTFKEITTRWLLWVFTLSVRLQTMRMVELRYLQTCMATCGICSSPMTRTKAGSKNNRPYSIQSVAEMGMC